MKKYVYIDYLICFQKYRAKGSHLSALLAISLIPISAEAKNKMVHETESTHIQMLFLMMTIFRIVDLQGFL